MFFAAMLHPCNTAGLIIWLKTNDDKWITFLFHTFFFLFQNWESTLAKMCNTTFHYYYYHIQYNIYYQMQYYFYFLFYYLQYHCQFYFQFHCQYSCA